MGDRRSMPLRVADGLTLDPQLKEALRPGELIADREGRMRRLPRFFYEVPSWQMARSLQLTPHFALWEFLEVDVREATVLRDYPRYVPCAVTLLATHLELFRQEIDTFVHIAANGGYRSPSHRHTESATPHLWGTAVNLYRIGDDYVDDQETIERYGRIARKLMPGVWVRPFGHGTGFTDDHLHLDLGYVTVVPHDAPGEEDTE